LGVGGLINAYRRAAEDALQNSFIVQENIQSLFEVRFEYDQMNDVMTIIKDYQSEKVDQVFDRSCCLKIRIDENHELTFTEKLKLIPGCRYEKLEGG
jgi:putative IMPACT (imprinted ancient) family translation regulator